MFCVGIIQPIICLDQSFSWPIFCQRICTLWTWTKKLASSVHFEKLTPLQDAVWHPTGKRKAKKNTMWHPMGWDWVTGFHHELVPPESTQYSSLLPLTESPSGGSSRLTKVEPCSRCLCCWCSLAKEAVATSCLFPLPVGCIVLCSQFLHTPMSTIHTEECDAWWQEAVWNPVKPVCKKLWHTVRLCRQNLSDWLKISMPTTSTVIREIMRQSGKAFPTTPKQLA